MNKTAENMNIIEKRPILGTIAVLLFVASSGPLSAFAAWNGSPYNQGETLNPECSPTQEKCTVILPTTSEPGADPSRSSITNPTNFYFKALPSPTKGPSVKSIAANSTGPNAGVHSYRMTFVTPTGETGQSPVSETITVVDGHAKVTLNIPTDPNGIATARNIYRTRANMIPLPLDYAQFFLISENTVPDNTTTTFVDTISDENLAPRWLSARNTTAGSFFGNNTSRPLFSIDPITGYVMIGQTPDLQAPFTQLDVAGRNMPIDNVGNLYVESNTTQGKDRGGQISIGGLYRSGGGSAIFGNISARKENDRDEDPRGYLNFATFGLEGAPAERARFTSAGEFLIGTTTTMLSKLGVFGNINSDHIIALTNPNKGAAARSFLKVSNVENNATDAVYFGVSGKGYNNIPEWNNQGLIVSGSGIKGGIRLFTMSGGVTVSTSNTVSPDFTIEQGTGKAGFGTSTPSGKVSIAQNSDNPNGGLWISNSTNQNFRSIYADKSGNLNFYGGNTAGILNTAKLNEAGAWTSASDATYKENIVDIGEKYDLEDILSIQPRYYTMKGTGKPQIGFIAQELKLIVPEVVEGEEGSMGISYGNMAALLVKGIKDVNAKIDNLAKSTISGIKSIFVDEIGAKKATFEQLAVSDGIELKDKTTGTVYCVFIDNGNIEKKAGTCSQNTNASTPVQASAVIIEEQSSTIPTSEANEVPKIPILETNIEPVIDTANKENPTETQTTDVPPSTDPFPTINQETVTPANAEPVSDTSN